jgi:hypothetical protein
VAPEQGDGPSQLHKGRALDRRVDPPLLLMHDLLGFDLIGHVTEVRDAPLQEASAGKEARPAGDEGKEELAPIHLVDGQGTHLAAELTTNLLRFPTNFPRIYY